MIPEFVTKLPFQIGGALVFFSLAVGSCVARDNRLAAEAVEKRDRQTVKEAQENGAKRNAKNDKVRADANKPGASGRLLGDPFTCRDC